MYSSTVHLSINLCIYKALFVRVLCVCVDDNINIDINDKNQDVENTAISEKVEETLEDVLIENDLKTKDVEK